MIKIAFTNLFMVFKSLHIGRYMQSITAMRNFHWDTVTANDDRFPLRNYQDSCRTIREHFVQYSGLCMDIALIGGTNRPNVLHTQ